MSSSTPLSALYHKRRDDDDDMSYLLQPRGRGWVFRMKTPDALLGTLNPWTGKPFGREIKKGLGTRLKREAMQARDMLLGQVRELEAQAKGAGTFSMEAAERWRTAIRGHEARATGGADDLDPRGILLEQVETEAQRPKRYRTTTDEDLEAFAAVALRSELLLRDALPRYLKARGEDAGRYGFQPLKPSTVRAVRTSVAYLLEARGEALCLGDVTPEVARAFLRDHLPFRTSKRSPKGPGSKTVDKHATMLAGLWDWAVEQDHLPRGRENPWRRERSVRRAKVAGQVREDFTAEQVRKLLAARPKGHRLGDAMRLALLTGCRSDELGHVRWEDVAADGSAFRVTGGKTDNAPRWVPLPPEARALVLARRETMPRDTDGRLLWDFPLSPDGVCTSLSKAFTYLRRKVLGRETDGPLVFHSFRHTWRTQALRVGLTDHHTHQLGGWKAEKSSSSPYNHGFTKAQLIEAQERIAEGFRGAGFMDAF